MPHTTKIDWRWVKEHVRAAERIRSGTGSDSSNALIKKTLDECLQSAKRLVEPRVLTKTIPSPTMRAGSSIAGYLKDAMHAVAFVVTIGDGLELAATKLMRDGKDLDGYLLDRIGSYAVESLAEALEKKLRKSYASKGLSISMRLSPGYCDWPIEGQFELDKIMNFSSAGVCLTDSCMMIPRKSISGLVAVGEKDRFSAIKSQCVICNKKDCSYRRV